MKRHLKRIGRRIKLSGCARRFARLSLTMRVLLATSAATITVIGCGWDGPSESVRFKGYGDERSYTRLPSLSVKNETNEQTRDDEADMESDYSDYQAEQQREQELKERWEKATAPPAVRSELERARRDLLNYLNETEDGGHDDYWMQSALTTQQRRNATRDLLDALAALDRGSAAEHVQAYIAARRAYDLWLSSPTQPTNCYYNCPTPEQQWREKDELKAAAERKAVEFHDALDSVPRDANLDDNVAYLRAAALYRDERFAEAAPAFNALVAKFPRSEKREAALFMYALSQLKQSSSYRHGDATALSSDPCTDCRDAAWTAARAAFSRVIRERSHNNSTGGGRLASDARGWLAFTSLRVGDAAGALAEYYRLLADETNKQARAEALNSLAMARSHADEEDMNRLEADLSDEPTVALTYAYHNLYNYAVDLSIHDAQFAANDSDGETEEPYSAVNSERREREQEKLVNETQQKEFRRVAEFAKRMLRRYPRAATSADFILRVAAASLELDDNRAAHAFAVRALALKVSGERREDALWIKGVAEYRLREYDAAQRTLSELVGDGTVARRLTKGARILLALVAEDAGDIGGALEQYLLLDYTADAAYFLDVLMSPEQLAAYITSHPQSAHLDELNYALGVRYLRAGRYTEARAAYARIRTSRNGGGGSYYNYNTGCNEHEGYSPSGKSGCESPKMPHYEMEKGIHERWVLRDLKTAETLEWYARAVEQAQGDEAKAETLYQMASYLYERDLLFYNPAAWRGSRYFLLSTLAESHNYRAPDEARRLWDYMQSHDMAARALPLYLEVVSRFPDTRAARDALYTAAVCHERLADYNNYWRGIYGDGLHAGARMVTYKDVRAAYPDYRLPHGTFGWEPSTRTVRGGPAWDELPKPKLRPTRAARIKMLLAAWIPPVVNYWNYSLSRLRYWLNVALLLAATLIAGRVAARTRRHLRLELARHKPLAELPELNESAPVPAMQPELAPWLTTEQATLGWAEQMALRLKPHADALYKRLRRRIEPLLHDARGRAALASNALSHTALIVLLFQLIRMI